MVPKRVVKQIDRVIKETWIDDIQKDYFSISLLREDSLKCAFYYHLRRKLAGLLEEYNLRIYSEYYFPALQYKADLAIVQINPNSKEAYFKDFVVDVIALFELKFTSGTSTSTRDWIKHDTAKLKNYMQAGSLSCQFYFAVIYEAERNCLVWMDRRSTNHWASGYVTELDAGRIDGELVFAINSYNGLNSDLNTE